MSNRKEKRKMKVRIQKYLKFENRLADRFKSYRVLPDAQKSLERFLKYGDGRFLTTDSLVGIGMKYGYCFDADLKERNEVL